MNSLRLRVLGLAGAAALLALPFQAFAADAVYSNWRGLAIGGADPVAYFTDGKYVDGSSDHTLEWMGATWRFTSAAHREQFTADPEKFAPQYGGYCAYAVANNSTASVDPAAWKIVDGKLYLNYSQSIAKEWQKDIPGYIAAADKNWPKLRDGR